VTAPDYRTAAQDDRNSAVAQNARESGKEVGEHARSAAADVKDTAAERARDVAGEARAQARDLVGHTRDTLAAHADEQTNRVAETVEQVAYDLRSMAASASSDGIAGRLVGDLADRADALANRMRGRNSADLLDDIRDFARRRPGTFLAGAAGLGLIVGRLGRGLKDASSSDSGRTTWPSEPYPADYPIGGAGLTREPTLGSGYSTGAGSTERYGSAYGTGVESAPAPGASYGSGSEYASGSQYGSTGEYGTTGLGDAETTSEFARPGYDTTALDTPDADADRNTGAYLGTVERDREGGSGYGS